MTKTECCGPPGTIFREDVASEVHPDQAPELTRACYTSFDYYNCKANCCEGDDTICVPNEMGGFCNLENGTDFYFDDGGNKQLITDDQTNLNKKLMALSKGSQQVLSEYKNKDVSSLTVCILDRPRHKKIIDKLKDLKVKIKLITDGDVSGALLVTDDKYNVDIFLGIGGGPEGVLAAAALDTFNCSFQGRFLFETDDQKLRAKNIGIKDLKKKYELNEIVSGDSLFCATGITSGDLVSGIEIQDNEFISETLVTHKSTGLKKVIKLKQNI